MSPGRIGGVVRIGGRRRRHAGKFAGRRFAQNNRAGATQKRNAGRVRERPIAVIDRRTHFCRHIERIDNVLDPDRHAVQRSAASFVIERARLSERQIRVEINPRLDDAVARRDAVHAIAYDGFACELARRDAPRDLCRAQFVQSVLGLCVHRQQSLNSFLNGRRRCRRSCRIRCRTSGPIRRDS
jgi:hypothetical protein